MDTKDKIAAFFERVEGPVPWLEIAIDEVVMLRCLNQPFPDTAFTSSANLDVSWEDKVDFAVQVGIDALGIYHWETFGCLRDESRPVLHRIPLILEASDLPKLEIPTFTVDDLYPEVQAAHAAVSKQGLALYMECAFCLDYLLSDMGFENLCLKLYDDPNFVHEMLERYTRYTLNLVEIYNQMPEIDFFWIGDDLAYKSGPFLSPGMYRKHIFPYFERIVSRIEKPWVFHSDGDISTLMEDILAWGPKAIHPLEPGAMDIFQVKRDYGSRVGLIGNLSVDQFARADTEEIIAQVEELLNGCAAGGGYAFSSGNALSRFISIDNLKAASQTLRAFNSHRYG